MSAVTRRLSAVVGAVLVAGMLGAPNAAAVVNSWHVAAQLALGVDDTAVSCPTTTTCWALEAGELISSSDGAAWTQRTDLVPAGIAALNDIDCPSATRCYLTATDPAGAPALLVLDQGAISTATAPGTAVLPTISCPGAKRCLTTDGTTVYTTTDGASTWQPHSLPSIVYTRPALGCVRATNDCWVVGDRGEVPLIERTVNGGGSWTLQTAPGTTDGLYDVSCPTTTTCYGSGANFSDHAVIIRTTNAGATWKFAQVPYQSYALRSVSCPAINACTAVGYSPGATPFVDATTDGAHWTSQTVRSVATGHPAQVSCPSESQCSIVAGGIAFATSDGGVSWPDAGLPAGIDAPAALACPSRSTCVGVGNDAAGRPQAITTADGGVTWLPRALPDGTGRLLAVDCPSTTQCFAVATTTVPDTGRSISQALHSEDGGVSWAFGRLTNRMGVLGRLTCASATTCLAGGFDNHSAVKLVRTVDGGHTWASIAAPGGGFYLDGIGCSATTSCVVVTNDSGQAPTAWTTPDLGTTYQPHSMPDTDIYDVDCSAALCAAVGSDGGIGAIDMSTDFGATWHPASVPAAAQLLGRVSCGSATSCAASSLDFSENGGPIVAGTRNAGASWRAFSVPARSEAPLAVACAGASCLASEVSATGNPIILAGLA